MRKLMVLLICSVLLGGGSSFAQPVTSPSNPHNLSSTSSNTVKATSDTRICVFCHTPHGASAQSVLWNRKAPATSSFPLYNSNTVDIKNIPAAQYNNLDPSTYPNGATRMCLSCHDGVSAIGEILSGQESGTSKIAMSSNTLNDAGSTGVVDLATSHPVSFVFSSTVKDAINTAEGAVNYALPNIVPLDSQERVQCTTCHDPHEDTRIAGTYELPFWRNFTGSDNEIADYDNTCQDCHQGTDWGGSWGGTPTPVH